MMKKVTICLWSVNNQRQDFLIRIRTNEHKAAKYRNIANILINKVQKSWDQYFPNIIFLIWFNSACNSCQLQYENKKSLCQAHTTYLCHTGSIQSSSK